jgi:hypothetical protein
VPTSGFAHLRARIRSIFEGPGLPALVCALLVLGGVAAGALGAAANSDEHADAVDSSSQAMRQAFERAQEQVAGAEAYRDSSAGRAERAHSDEAFTDQPDDQALATARKEFPGLVSSPPLQWPPLDKGQEIERYLSPHSAVVDVPGARSAVLESDLPLRGETPDGDRAPLDMGLTDQGDSFEPKSTAAAVQIPKSSDGHLRFPDQGLGLEVAGAHATDAKLTQNKVFFANALTDTDVVAEPTPGGAEISLVLRSPDSPDDPALGFDLPAGAALRLAGAPNTAEVVRDGKRLAAVDPATAVDAQGRSIPVTYRVDGDRLVMDLGDTSDVAWPVMVDPNTYVYDNNGQSVAQGSTGFSWPGWQQISSRSQSNPCPYPAGQSFYECKQTDGSITIWGFVGVQPPYVGYDHGAFRKPARSGTYIYSFHAANMSHTANQSISFGGICSINCGAWLGGHWSTPLDKATNVVNKTGTSAMRTNGASFAGQTDDYCYDPTAAAPSTACPLSTTANAAPQVNTTAEWGMLMTGVAPTAQPHAAMGGAATLSADNKPPSIVSATHSNTPNSSTWVQSYTDTATLRAADNNAEVNESYTYGSDTNVSGQHLTGVGLGSVSVAGPGGGGTQAFWCSTTTNYDECPQVWTFAGITYTAPEGTSTYTASSTDIVGNSQNGPSWTVKVDNHAPTGSFTNVPTATNGTASITGTMTDALSGPQDAKVQYQASGSSSWVDACARQATTADFTCNWNTAGLAEGTYSVRAELRDKTAVPGPNVGYTATATVVVDRTPPDELTDIAPAVGSDGYSEDLTDSGLTQVAFVQHDTRSGVAATTLEYNDAIDGTASGPWLAAAADPATGDGEATTYWSTDDVPDGLHLVRATTMDNAGNPRQKTIQVRKAAKRKRCLTTAAPGEQACYAGYAIGTAGFSVPPEAAAPPCTKSVSGISDSTVQAAFNNLNPGDVLCFGGGLTYGDNDGEFSIPKDKTNVTVESTPGQPQAELHGRLAIHANNVTVRDMRLNGQNLLQDACSSTDANGTCDGCEWEPAGVTRCPMFGLTINGSHDKLIHNDITTKPKGAPQYSLTDTSPAAVSTHTNCIDIEIWDNGRPTGTVIKDNVIHDCGLPIRTVEFGRSDLNPPSAGGGHWHGIYVGNAGPEASSSDPGPANHTVISNNVLYRNGDRGIQLVPDAQWTDIVHNTLYDNGMGINIDKLSSHNKVQFNIVANSRDGTNSGFYNYQGTYPYQSTSSSTNHADGANQAIYNVYTVNGAGPANVISNNCLWEAYDNSTGTASHDLTGIDFRDRSLNPQLRNPGVQDFKPLNPLCQSYGANPTGYRAAFGIKDKLTVRARPSSTVTDKYTQAVAARLESSSFKFVTTGVTDGWPCKKGVRDNPGKWIAFYRYRTAGTVTHTQCVSNVPVPVDGTSRSFAAFVGKNGSTTVDKVRVPGRGLVTIPRSGQKRWSLRLPMLAEVFGMTNNPGRKLAGEFSSVKYATQVVTGASDWQDADDAHTFPITSSANGYRTAGVGTNPFAHFCVFGPTQSGETC